MAFDYGKVQSDGQYERYPTNTEGEYVAPLRRTYVHKTCEGVTTCGESIAVTYAKNPKYYTRTFCTMCRAHYPIQEFYWHEDGVTLGNIKEETNNE